MIANRLRHFFTSCWLAIASPAPSGSSYIQTMQPVCYGGSIAGMLRWTDQQAMNKVLHDKYGIAS
ncbi:hypothetical protein [Mesorhizobium sp. M7A.F.Ca.CA.004.02.1.1]|uniref:hypothetical protein n=1 Tax=Mesorhizobium sp. M7A.F.Ca.CA.004.02.1.1 TaxID=2496690 RepID=UPI001FE01AFC|nr:hypothetical protein [Mesorhizobium sp. M7A.F.Ca.CA.004.02.1.1]